MESSKRYSHWGFPFQLVLIATFLIRTYAFSGSEDTPLTVTVIGLVGMVIFGWCLYNLYFQRRRLNGLITTGVFKYTRHPMYTGLVMMDMKSWFVQEYSPYLLTSAVVFYLSVLIAAYFQEKETTARFGDSAVNYYKATPRLFLLYPFCR